MNGRRPLVPAALVVVLALAGCGGRSHRPAAHVETIPGNGSFPAVTETVYGNSVADCGNAADAYAPSARLYLAHEGAASAYPADLYYLGMRDALRDFDVRECSLPILSGVLAKRFTRQQLRTLLADLPRTMAPVIRAALAR